MINQINLSSILIITWQTWLFSLVVALVAGGFVFIILRKKMKTILNDNGALHQRIVECTELLNYSKESERKAKEETELSNRSKSLLLAKLSHEIRTPMNGVIGMASLLAETELTAEQREYAEVIIQSSESLMTTINDMLVTDVIGYTENSNIKMELEEKDYDLRGTVEGVLDSFANKAAKTGIELVYQMDRDVPEMIIGD